MLKLTQAMPMPHAKISANSAAGLCPSGLSSSSDSSTIAPEISSVGLGWRG